MIDAFETDVFVNCDRDAAKAALSKIETMMHTVNGAATKGEHNIFPSNSDLLNHYWDLHSVFRESDHEGESLAYNWQLDVHSKTKH